MMQAVAESPSRASLMKGGASPKKGAASPKKSTGAYSPKRQMYSDQNTPKLNGMNVVKLTSAANNHQIHNNNNNVNTPTAGNAATAANTPTSHTNNNNNNNTNNNGPDDSKNKSDTNVRGYQLHEILGKGSFGQVFKATRFNRTYAIKMIDKALIRKKNLQKYVNNEVKVMHNLQSAHTVRLFEAFEDKDVLYLVMECCNQGTLFNYILKMKPGETECIRIFAQIMRGFIEIHEKHILHRDLKPSNIFINDGVFKIADFGLALPKALGSSYCGTSYFMAPEILNKQVHDYKVDLWSMGVILFFMIFREYPFKNSAKLLDEITLRTIPIFDPYKCLKHQVKTTICSPGLLDLFQRIFVMDPKKRISFKELYGLEIFSEFFSANELRNSSKIYHDLEKKLPEDAAVSAAAAAEVAANVEDEDDDDDDDQEGVDDAAKTKKQSSKKGIQQIQQYTDTAGGKLRTSKFKPQNIGGNSPKQQQQQQQTTAQMITGGSPRQAQKISDFRGAISIKETLVSSTKTTGLPQQNNHLNKSDDKKVEDQHFNNQDKQLQQGIQQDKQSNSNSNSNDDSPFGDDDAQFDDIDVDEDPQIEMKNIKMLRKKQRTTEVNIRNFGPKAFHDQAIMLPKSKSKRVFDEDENSIPNAPSTLNVQMQSYHSINLAHHHDQLNISHSSNNNNNPFKLSQLNIGSSNSIHKKPSQQNNVDVPEVSDDDDDEMQKEQDNVRKSLPIDFRENEAANTEENLRKMPFRKAPSMRMNIIDSAVKDKLNKKIIQECEEVFERHVQVYLYEIGIYGILGDTIDSLNVLNLNSSTQSLVNYILAKLLLFYATKLLTSLQSAKNVFNLELFYEFTKSSPAQLLIGKISRDVDQWSMKFSLFYYGINHESDIQSEKVRKIVTEDVIETDFDTELKIPVRLVLDLIFKASYKMGRSCSSELQASGILRTSLYILLSMLINNVFDKSRVKDYLYHYFNDPKNNEKPLALDFVDFSLWTAQANREILLKQIHHLVHFIFGERKLALLQNIQ